MLEGCLAHAHANSLGALLCSELHAVAGEYATAGASAFATWDSGATIAASSATGEQRTRAAEMDYVGQTPPAPAGAPKQIMN